MNRFVYIFNNEYTTEFQFYHAEEIFNKIFQLKEISIVEFKYFPVVYDTKIYLHAYFVYDTESQIALNLTDLVNKK